MKKYLAFVLMYFKIFGLKYFLMRKPELYNKYPNSEKLVKIQYSIHRVTEISDHVIDEGFLEGTENEVYLKVRKLACDADYNTISFFGISYKLKVIED